MIGDNEDLDRCVDCGEDVDECVCYVSYDGEEYPYDGEEYDEYDGEVYDEEDV